MMKIIAIDPGTTESGFAFLDCERGVLPKLVRHGIWPNESIAEMIVDPPEGWAGYTSEAMLVIEEFRGYGTRFPLSCIIAVRWSGSFAWAWRTPRSEAAWMPRAEVKSILTGRANSKDADVRQAIIDLYGPGKDKAIGTVKAPGPLHGVRKDEWSAIGLGLACAIRYFDLGLQPWGASVRVEAM